MGIPWSGATQSQGSPKSYYKYEAEYTNRTTSKVHVRLKLWVRMRDYSNYFSFQIAHETYVYPVEYGKNGVYQWAWVKQGRGWWGHQWSGSSWLWTEGSYDYNGANWHGPYIVFDRDVPIGVDDDTIYIVPVITRPPCLYDPYNFDWSYTPWLDKTNWYNNTGYWRPWSATEYPWYFWHYDHRTEEDMAFGNNRWLEPLGNGTKIGKYPRVPDIKAVNVVPSRIDVANQDTQEVTASWTASKGATHYQVWVTDSLSASAKKHIVSSSCKNNTITFNPKRYFVGGKNWKSTEIFDGKKLYVFVQPYDSQNVSSSNPTHSKAVEYYEVKGASPNLAYVIGRNGRKNDAFFRGENPIRMYYSGESDGSYPISRFVLHRVKDGAEVSWPQNYKVGGKDSRKQDANGKYVEIAFPGWSVPNDDVVFELRAYNSKNRPVYLKGKSEWYRFTVHYYGGILYAWGKSEWYGNETAYGRLPGYPKWNEGLARVWDGSSWRESELVYVWDGYWKGM